MITLTEEQKAALSKMREPFPPNQISKLCRSTKKDNPKGSCKVCGGYHGLPAIALDYVGHAALTDRLLDADPCWRWEPMALDPMGYPAIDRDGGMWIKLTVAGMTRLGYGDAQGKSGGDAMKERIGDALRNAAMRFGAALDLWHKGELHVEEDGDGTKNDTKVAEYHERVKTALKTIHGDDSAAKKTTIKRVAGIEDYRKLDAAKLKTLCEKLEKAASTPPVDICNECRQPVTAHAESCPNATPPAKCPICDFDLDTQGTCTNKGCVPF